MKKLLYSLVVLHVTLSSCERRELALSYQPKVPVIFNTDWSDMSEVPTGMSIYCYPESGDTPTIVTTNNIATATAYLRTGTYKVLVFNQIPTDYGTIVFSGMSTFETAEIAYVSSSTTSATASSVSGSVTIRDPEEIAVATYFDLEITSDAVKQYSMLSDNEGFVTDGFESQVIDLVPVVVVKTTRVTLRVSGVTYFSSATSSLYGMASGYHFDQQKCHDVKVVHTLNSWSATRYEENSGEGEIVAYFTCFGLPNQTTDTRTEDYSDWDGVIDIDILLGDGKTVVSKTLSLNGMVSTRADEEDDSTSTTVDDSDVDISIDAGFGDTSEVDDDDDPIELPSVEISSDAASAFDAVIDEWGEEVLVDMTI